jgi:ribosome maturation factor RimP
MRVNRLVSGSHEMAKPDLERNPLFPYICIGNNCEKGTRSFPSSFLHMEASSQIQVFEQKVAALIADEPSFFLVEIRIKPTNNIKVFLDGDQGISIEKLVQLNRKLYKDLEESNFFPNGDFSLEVSSAGLDEPLKMHRQYIKNKGRFIEVLLNDGVKREGKLLEVTDDSIVVEEETGKNKKKQVVQHTILFDHIKTTKIQIKF